MMRTQETFGFPVYVISFVSFIKMWTSGQTKQTAARLRNTVVCSFHAGVCVCGVTTRARADKQGQNEPGRKVHVTPAFKNKSATLFKATSRDSVVYAVSEYSFKLSVKYNKVKEEINDLSDNTSLVYLRVVVLFFL